MEVEEVPEIEPAIAEWLVWMDALVKQLTSGFAKLRLEVNLRIDLMAQNLMT